MAQENIQAVILTALPVEFKAVQAFLSDCKEDVHPTKQTVYERGKFAANGKCWDVGIVEIGPGNVDAALETGRALDHFNPQVVLFVGIAGGIKDLHIGDVVAATKIYGYESGKAEALTFKPRPEVGESSYALVQRARAEARNGHWLQRLSSSSNHVPDAYVRPIAAGEKVVASTQSAICKFLQVNYSDAVAVEMEGYGFLRAAYPSQQTTSAIVVRGISDLIDNKNDDTNQEPEDIRQAKASHHASAFAFQLLSNFEPNVSLLGSQASSPKVEPQIWEDLFSYFQESDLSSIAPLCQQVFEEVLTPEQRDPYPELSRLDTLETLKIVFKRRDDLGLVVNWVGRVIHAFENPEEGIATQPVPTNLKDWYKARTTSELEAEPVKKPPGYLLIALDPTYEEDRVFFTAELHGADGTIEKTDFVPSGTKCSIDDISDLLSDVIPMAGEVQAVEIFLSWQHLNQPVHKWKIRASGRSGGRRNQRQLWRIPRNTLVRSLDRLKDKQWTVEWLNGLHERWQKLQNLDAVTVQDICCVDCFNDELFEGALDKKLVFKFLANLPEDTEDLQDLLYEVITSKVPVWLWSYDTPDDPDSFSNTLDTLLNVPNLSDASTFAKVICDQRPDLLDLGLLFDCPSRLPRLPVLVVDEHGQLRQPAT